MIDKRYFNTDQRQESPLEIATQALFRRTEIRQQKDCRIIFDQMDSQLKSIKREQGKILRIANTKIEIAKEGSEKPHRVSVRFDKSCNSNFLQLADMVAYNTWRQFVDYGDKWGADANQKMPMYEYFERISKCFCRSDSIFEGVELVRGLS